MAKTVSKQEIQAVVQMHGANPFTLAWLEAASQTFVKGELVAIDASGFVAEITGTDTPGAIYGVAAGSGHNTTAGAAQSPVELATTQQLFAGNVLEVAAADHVLLQADLGQDMAIQHVTADSKWYLNATTKAGANIRVRTHVRARGTDIGDTNGRVLFNFKPNWIQFEGTS